MRDTCPNPFDRDAIDPSLLGIWQSVVDLIASAFGVPVGLIMRVDGPDIEVFVSSNTRENPYRVGDKEPYVDSGLYCEWVVKNEGQLLVPNASKDAAWKSNPDVKLGMISYLGLPIRRPDGHIFGTICVLDTKENAHSSQALALLDKFRLLVESHLAVTQQQQQLEEIDQQLRAIQTVIPICQYCKSVRDENGEWIRIEALLRRDLNRAPSHGICPTCVRERHPELLDDETLAE